MHLEREQHYKFYSYQFEISLKFALSLININIWPCFYFCFGPCLYKLDSNLINMVRAFAHGTMGRQIDPSWWTHWAYFSFQPVLHDWCNKGCGMCYPVCGMMHIKEPLLLIRKSSPCGGSGFHLSLSEWSFTICLTPYNRK